MSSAADSTPQGRRIGAGLCSHERRSTILVFFAGSSDRVDEIAEDSDLQYQQVLSDGRTIGYSRLLALATPNMIRRRARRKAGDQTAIDHDGIEDSYMEKGSVIWYCSKQKWTKLMGSD